MCQYKYIQTFFTISSYCKFGQNFHFYALHDCCYLPPIIKTSQEQYGQLHDTTHSHALITLYRVSFRITYIMLGPPISRFVKLEVL